MCVHKTQPQHPMAPPILIFIAAPLSPTEIAMPRDAAGLNDGLEDWHEFGRNGEFVSDNFLGAPLESPNVLAEHDPEGLEQTTNLVLEPNPHAHQGIAGSQQRPSKTSAMALKIAPVTAARTAHTTSICPT